MSAVLTLKMLTDARACSEQVQLFRSLFGESVNVTVAKARKVAGKFNWSFAMQFLDDEGRAEYQRVRGEAWAECKRVRDDAWAEYERVRDDAWAEYERVRGEAWAECKRVRDDAWAEYQRVSGEAWAAAYIATCKRAAGKEAA